MKDAVMSFAESSVPNCAAYLKANGEFVVIFFIFLFLLMFYSYFLYFLSIIEDNAITV